MDVVVDVVEVLFDCLHSLNEIERKFCSWDWEGDAGVEALIIACKYLVENKFKGKSILANSSDKIISVQLQSLIFVSLCQPPQQGNGLLKSYRNWENSTSPCA